MITEVIRMIAQPLSDEVLGVATKMALLELEEGDTTPPIPIIYHAAKHAVAVAPSPKSSSYLVGDAPLLVIAIERPAQVVLPGVRGKAFDYPSLQVSIAYVTRKADLAEAWRDADYTFHAVFLSLFDGLFASDKADARTRGKVVIVKQNEPMAYGPNMSEVALGRIIGAAQLDLYVRINP
jgi:hypothetical protein